MASHYDEAKKCRVGTMDEPQFQAESDAENGRYFRDLIAAWQKAGGGLKWGAGGVSLRAPFDGKDVILRSLEMADDLKLNDDELGIVAGRLDLPGTDPELHVAELIKRFDLRCVTVTCGARGAWSLDVDGNHARVEGRPLDGPLVDTVGAGDGFAAVSIAGFIRDWTPQQTLERADAFARRLCLVRGAIPDEEWTGFQDLQD